jgi:hypothetical protein
MAGAASGQQPRGMLPASGSALGVAVGRSHPGLYGIARSSEEAREALTLARRLRNWPEEPLPKPG